METTTRRSMSQAASVRSTLEHFVDGAQ